MKRYEERIQRHKERRKKILTILGTATLVIGLATWVGIIAFTKYRAPIDAARFFAQGEELTNSDNHAEAFRRYRQAARKAPSESRYQRAAALAAGKLGQIPAALDFAHRAWKGGEKDDQVFAIIAAGYALKEENKEENLAEALAHYEQLSADKRTPSLKGDTYALFNKRVEAIQEWLAAIAEDPTPDLIAKVAAGYELDKDYEKALALLQQHREQIDEEGFSLLAGLVVPRGDRAAVEAVFREAQERGHYGDQLRLEHALYHLLHHRLTEAANLLEALREPRDTSGGDEAATAANRVRIHARIFLGYIYFSRGDGARIEGLHQISLRSPEHKWNEGERTYYQGLKAVLAGDAGALKRLSDARALVPRQPAINVVYAAEAIRAGDYGKAVEACSDISGLLRGWVAARYLLALALHKDGKDDQAFAVLYHLHRSKAYSKESLQLFRDVSLRRSLNQFGEASQDLLEKQFPDDPKVQLWGGISALGKGDFARAEAVYAKLLKDFPEDERLKLGPVQVLLAKGEFDQVLAACEKLAVATELKAPFEGFAHLGKRQFDAARDAFKRAVEAPQPPLVHLEYGKLLMAADDREGAAAEFRAALEADPKAPDAHYGLALIARAEERPEDLARHAEALRAAGDRLSAAHHVLLAFLDRRSGQGKRALMHCDSALEQEPTSVPALTLRGMIRADAGDEAAAAADFKAVLEKQPDNADVLERLILVRVRQRQFEDALALAGRLLEIVPAERDTPARELQFQIAGLGGLLEPAAGFLAGLKPRLEPAPFALHASWMAALEGEPGRAESILQPHLDHPEAAFRWAYLRLGKKDGEGALRAVEPHTLSAQQWTSLAVKAERANLPAAVLHAYRKAVRAAPENPQLLNNWAWYELQQDGGDVDLEAVIAAGRKAVDALPNSISAHDTLAEALLRAERYQDCVDLLGSATQLTLRNPQLLYALGRSYEGLGDREKALNYYRQCRKLLLRGEDQQLRQGRDELVARMEQLKDAR